MHWQDHVIATRGTPLNTFVSVTDGRPRLTGIGIGSRCNAKFTLVTQCRRCRRSGNSAPVRPHSLPPPSTFCRRSRRHGGPYYLDSTAEDYGTDSARAAGIIRNKESAERCAVSPMNFRHFPGGTGYFFLWDTLI